MLVFGLRLVFLEAPYFILKHVDNKYFRNNNGRFKMVKLEKQAKI